MPRTGIKKSLKNFAALLVVSLLLISLNAQAEARRAVKQVEEAPFYCVDPAKEQVLDAVRPFGNGPEFAPAVCEADFIVNCGDPSCNPPYDVMNYALLSIPSTAGCQLITQECLSDLYMQYLYYCGYCQNAIPNEGSNVCQPFVLTCNYRPYGSY